MREMDVSTAPDTPQSRPSVEPPAAAPGEDVVVTMDDLPPDTGFYVGFGELGGNHELITQTQSDGEGHLSQTVAIPEWADRSLQSFFFLAAFDQRPFAFSDRMLITDEDGLFTVEGTITGAVGDCHGLRGPNEESYALVIDGEPPAPGEVIVVGRLAENGACPSGLSIEVVEVRRH